MCVCVCVCVIYICIRIIYICIHTYVYMYLCIYVYVYIDINRKPAESGGGFYDEIMYKLEGRHFLMFQVSFDTVVGLF